MPIQRWYPASLTKLMTAYTDLPRRQGRRADAGKRRSSMSKNAAAEPPSKMYYKPGQTDDARQRAEDHARSSRPTTLPSPSARPISGSEPAFVDQHECRGGKRIGMTSSHFVNPNGLPGTGQYTTARDLAVLAITIKREFPEYAPYFAL